MEFFSASFRLIAGLLLTIVSVVAVLRWFITSIEARNPWYSSPFLWIGTLISLLLGLALLGSILSKEKDPAIIKKVRTKMIRIYFSVTIGTSVILVIAHEVISDSRLLSPQTYVPIIILAAIVNYAICYSRFIRKADYQTQQRVLIPLLFLTGSMISPFVAVTAYNEIFQRVEVLKGSDIFSAHSDFLRFTDLALDRNRLLTYQREWHDENIYHADYDLLVPVIVQPNDTLYRVWIELPSSGEFDGALPEDSIRSLIRNFQNRCRQRVRNFNLDSVVFYDASGADAKKVLVIDHYPIVEGTIFLKPQYASLVSYESSLLIPLIFLYCIISLSFWFVSSGASKIISRIN